MGRTKRNQDKLDILGLTIVEKSVFSALPPEKAIPIRTIAETAKVPRTSAVSALERLLERGLARKVSVGKRTHWKRRRAERIRSDILSFADSIGVMDGIENKGWDTDISRPEQVGFTFVKGIHEILRVQERLISRRSSDRIRFLQTAGIVDMVIRKSFVEEFSRLNERIRENGIITELVVSENALRRYEKLLSTNPSWGASLTKRLFDMYVVDDELLRDNVSDVAIFKNLALVTNWKEETMSITKNPDVVRLLVDLFRALKKSGRKFNPNFLFRKQ